MKWVKRGLLGPGVVGNLAKPHKTVQNEQVGFE